MGILFKKKSPESINKNIEIVNDHLWAVKFSLIPYIPEIDYKPDPMVPAYQEWGRLADDGLLLLNKDHANFLYLKAGFPKLMGKSKKQLKLDFQSIKKLKNKGPSHEVHFYMYQCELERREKMKKARWFRGNY